MNAYAKTAHGIASALLGTPRISQTVSWVKSWNYGSPYGPSHLVLVTPEGKEFGTYYECSDRTFALLRNGMSPEHLDLEAVEGFDDEEDDEIYWTGLGPHDPAGKLVRFG